jgi:hypothetical protein
VVRVAAAVVVVVAEAVAEVVAAVAVVADKHQLSKRFNWKSTEIFIPIIFPSFNSTCKRLFLYSVRYICVFCSLSCMLKTLLILNNKRLSFFTFTLSLSQFQL